MLRAFYAVKLVACAFQSSQLFIMFVFAKETKYIAKKS